MAMPRVRKFPGEIFECGEPDLRPAEGHIVLSRTRGMEALEARYRQYALLATVMGDRHPMSPTALLAELEKKCGVSRARVRVEVTYPADFFLLFELEDECDRVLHQSRDFRCCGCWMSFSRWSRCSGAQEEELKYYSKLSFEGMPANAWESEFVSNFVTALKGKLVSIEPRTDRWCITVYAWLKNPCSVHKRYKVEIPEPLPPPRVPSSDSDDPYSPPAPVERKVWRTLTYNCIVHVEEVLDRGPLMTDFVPLGSSDEDEDEDTTRLHEFPVWPGRIDGTGPSNETDSGGHSFRGPGNGGMDGGFLGDAAV